MGGADFDLVVDCAPTSAGSQLLQDLAAAPTHRLEMEGGIVVECPVTLTTDLSPAVTATMLVFVIHGTFLCRLALTGFTKTVLQQYGYEVQPYSPAQPVPAPSSSPTTVSVLWEHRGAPPRGLASCFPAGMHHVVVATVVPPCSDPTLSRLPREWLGPGGRTILTARVLPPALPDPPHTSTQAAAAQAAPATAPAQATPAPPAQPPPAASTGPAQHHHRPMPASTTTMPQPSQLAQPGHLAAGGHASGSGGAAVHAPAAVHQRTHAQPVLHSSALGAQPMQCDSQPTSIPTGLASLSPGHVAAMQPMECDPSTGAPSNVLVTPNGSLAAPATMQREQGPPILQARPPAATSPSDNGAGPSNQMQLPPSASTRSPCSLAPGASVTALPTPPPATVAPDAMQCDGGQPSPVQLPPLGPSASGTSDPSQALTAVQPPPSATPTADSGAGPSTQKQQPPSASACRPCSLAAPQWAYGVASTLFHSLKEQYEDRAVGLGGGELGARRVFLLVVQAMDVAANVHAGAWRLAQLRSGDTGGGDGSSIPRCVLTKARESAASLFKHPSSQRDIPVTVPAFLEENLPGLQLSDIPELASTRSTRTSQRLSTASASAASRPPPSASAKNNKKKTGSKAQRISTSQGEQAATDHSKRHQRQEPGTPSHADKRQCSPARQRQSPGRPHPPAPDPSAAQASQPPPAAPGPAGSGSA